MNVLGIEDVTANFHMGLTESARKNPLSAEGIPTVMTLNARRPTVINYIMAVAKIPAKFDRVVAVEAASDLVSLRAVNGATASAKLDLDFLGAPAIHCTK